jgi:hypothetical protein
LQALSTAVKIRRTSMSNFQTVREWDFSVVVSLTKVGDIIRVTSGRILFTLTGDARVCLDMGLHLRKGHRFQTLYAFVVSAKATLVFLLLNVILGTILTLLLRP